jgi:hypothetical protein
MKAGVFFGKSNRKNIMDKSGAFRGELILNRRIPTYKNYYHSVSHLSLLPGAIDGAHCRAQNRYVLGICPLGNEPPADEQISHRSETGLAAD